MTIRRGIGEATGNNRRRDAIRSPWLQGDSSRRLTADRTSGQLLGGTPWKPVLRDSRELRRAIAITPPLSDKWIPPFPLPLSPSPRRPGKQRPEKWSARWKARTTRPSCFSSSKDNSFPLIERKLFPPRKSSRAVFVYIRTIRGVFLRVGRNFVKLRNISFYSSYLENMEEVTVSSYPRSIKLVMRNVIFSDFNSLFFPSRRFNWDFFVRHVFSLLSITRHNTRNALSPELSIETLDYLFTSSLERWWKL